MSEPHTPLSSGRAPAALTDAETRAGLRAVGRILELARDQAGRPAGAAKLADVLGSAGVLPELIARPGLFRTRFRPALERLAERYREYAPVLSEFDRSTRPALPKPRRRLDPHAHYWIDCGEAD